MSNGGKLHSCPKSQPAITLESLVTIPDTEPQANVVIIEGSALVNSMPPRSTKTFDEYAVSDVLPTTEAYSTQHKRTDIVFNAYQPSCLKAKLKSKRRLGVRPRVTSNCKISPNWLNFLRDSDKNTKMFDYLTDKIVRISTRNGHCDQRRRCCHYPIHQPTLGSS